MIWSLCPFFNEVEVLEIRLATLDPVVDRHVIAEATHTYSGDPKPLHFIEAGDRFDRWRDKIEYVVVDDMPEGDSLVNPPALLEPSNTSHWRRENHQRAALARGFSGMESNDLVFISDCDEIPNPELFGEAPKLIEEYGSIIRPRLGLHVLYANWRWPEAVPVIARFMYGQTIMAASPQAVRLMEGWVYGPTHPRGLGWHLSYLGGTEMVQYKIEKAAHHELNVPQFKDPAHIEYCMRHGTDLFGRPDKDCHWVPLDALPPYLAENAERFNHLLIDAEELVV